MNANLIIEKLGGTNQVARLCEVSKSAVSQWRVNGIPKSRLMYLKLAHGEVFESEEPRLPPINDCQEVA